MGDDRVVGQREYDQLKEANRDRFAGIERDISEIQQQQRQDSRTATETREADNKAHAADFRLLDEKIERVVAEHAERHERERREAAESTTHRGDSRWSHTLAIITIALGVAGLYIEILLNHK